MTMTLYYCSAISRSPWRGANLSCLFIVFKQPCPLVASWVCLRKRVSVGSWSSAQHPNTSCREKKQNEKALLLKQGRTVHLLFWREEGWLNYGPQMQKDIETKITLWKYLATAVTFKLSTVNSKHWEMNGLQFGLSMTAMISWWGWKWNMCPHSAFPCEGSTSLPTLLFGSRQKMKPNQQQKQTTLFHPGRGWEKTLELNLTLGWAFTF